MFPFFLYLNATYCGYLLKPVFEYANSSLWTYPYPPRDLGESCTSCALMLSRNRFQGSVFPNATGDPRPHTDGVERESNPSTLVACFLPNTATESGNMLIMALSHARASGNGILLRDYVRWVWSVRRSAPSYCSFRAVPATSAMGRILGEPHHASRSGSVRTPLEMRSSCIMANPLSGLQQINGKRK